MIKWAKKKKQKKTLSLFPNPSPRDKTKQQSSTEVASIEGLGRVIPDFF